MKMFFFLIKRTSNYVKKDRFAEHHERRFFGDFLQIQRQVIPFSWPFTSVDFTSNRFAESNKLVKIRTNYHNNLETSLLRANFPRKTIFYVHLTSTNKVTLWNFSKLSPIWCVLWRWKNNVCASWKLILPLLPCAFI